MDQAARQDQSASPRISAVQKLIRTGTLTFAATGCLLGLTRAERFEAQEDVSVLLPESAFADGASSNLLHEASSPADGITVGDLPADLPIESDVIASGDESMWYAGAVSCTTCGQCGQDGCSCHEPCDPPGIAQLFARIHDKGKACWIGRADALILWRNAPPDRPLVNNPLAAGTLLNANGLDSTTAAGPRVSIFRVNNCTGHAFEATYLRAANWRSQRPLGLVDLPYNLAAPGIYGNAGLTFDTANVNLGSRLQSFEFNRHHCHGEYVRFLAGFRWIEWQEQFTMQANSTGGISDFYQTDCINDLYGGQIGLDANLFGAQWFRLDGLIKAGAYYNNAGQSSEYTTNDPANPGTATVRAGESPLNGAFVGEVGLTGVVPLTRQIDFRIGYFGLWLSGIAQPTQQLSGQQLTPGQPAVGSINADGGVVVQGVSLGLEGRW